MPILPRDVKKAMALLQADPARMSSVDDLAAACGVARRTLEKHFRRFVGRSPSQVRRAFVLERVRRELLRAGSEANITEIAVRCGVSHLGRFAVAYRRRYGERPSVTLQRRKQGLGLHRCSPTTLSPTVDRPVVSVHPFDPIGSRAQFAAIVADEISCALLGNRWLTVGSTSSARYHLRGSVRDHGTGRLQIMVMLTDAATGRHLWADRWRGGLDDALAFEERVATGVATAVERCVRTAEIQRASYQDPARLGAWGLTMKALPRALFIEASAQAEALELLERAMELAPQDPLPMALAAWCHAQLGSHYMAHLAPRPGAEKQAARELALRAARLNPGDAVVEALVGAAHLLAHDLEVAAVHCERALTLDGGCVWGWNRSGLLNVYLGRSADAIECFQLARSLGPNDPLNFFCSLGTGCAHFEAGRYDEAARWFTRGLAEHPPAVWVNRFRSAAFVLAGRKEEARQSFAELTRAYPAITIGQVRSALPHTPSFRDRVCEGLDCLGMHS